MADPDDTASDSTGGESAVTDLDDREQTMCPGCLGLLERDVPFCTNCGMPVGQFATLDPIKLIYAQGWGYRRALSAPPSKIVLAGMWLIFAPLVLVTLMQLSVGMFRGNLGYDALAILLLVLSVGVSVVYGIILWCATANYLRRSRIESKHCEVCGHDLRGLTEQRCPECGTAFNPNDREVDATDGPE